MAERGTLRYFCHFLKFLNCGREGDAVIFLSFSDLWQRGKDAVLTCGREIRTLRYFGHFLTCDREMRRCVATPSGGRFPLWSSPCRTVQSVCGQSGGRRALSVCPAVMDDRYWILNVHSTVKVIWGRKASYRITSNKPGLMSREREPNSTSELGRQAEILAPCRRCTIAPSRPTGG